MLQQTAFPNLRLSAITGLQGSRTYILDTSNSQSKRSLQVPGLVFSLRLWNYNPPKPECLHIRPLSPGIQDGTKKAFLSAGLLDLKVVLKLLPLRIIAPMLCVSLTLRVIVQPSNKDAHSGSPQAVIDCSKRELPQPRTLPCFWRGGCTISLRIFRKEGGASPRLPVIAELPLMPSISSCIIVFCDAAEFQQLLKLLPNICDLVFAEINSAPDNEEGMDDIQIQAVAACTQLKRLKLWQCHNISQVGLISLCHCLQACAV